MEKVYPCRLAAMISRVHLKILFERSWNMKLYQFNSLFLPDLGPILLNLRIIFRYCWHNHFLNHLFPSVYCQSFSINWLTPTYRSFVDGIWESSQGEKSWDTLIGHTCQSVDGLLDLVPTDWSISVFLFKFLTLTKCQNSGNKKLKKLTLVNFGRLDTEM